MTYTDGEKLRIPTKKLYLTLLLLALLTISSTVFLKKAYAQEESACYADPQTVTGTNFHVGDKFNVTVMVENLTNAYTLGFDVYWDPNYLNLTNRIGGDALTGAVFMPGGINYTLGYAWDIALGLLGAPTGQDVTLGSLATLEFTILRPGKSVINITGLEFYNYYGERIEPYEDSPYDCYVDISETIIHEVVWDELTFYVKTVSNSTVSNFTFNQPAKIISFNVSGIAGTTGYVNVTIPKELLNAQPDEWEVYIDTTPTTPQITENTTHTFIYINYTHTTHTISIKGTEVIPDFPSTFMLLAVGILIMTIAAFLKVVCKKNFKVNNKFSSF